MIFKRLNSKYFLVTYRSFVLRRFRHKAGMTVLALIYMAEAWCGLPE